MLLSVKEYMTKVFTESCQGKVYFADNRRKDLK